MKKNNMLRIASVLLVAVLLSTCAISGVFANYMTTIDNDTDKAHVAAWGVKIVSDDAGDLGLFDKEYAKTEAGDLVDKATGEDIVNTVISSNEWNLVAPGTGDTWDAFDVTGTPEVAVRVAYTAVVELENWSTNLQDAANTEYCPVVFTVGTATYGMNNTNATNKYDTVADLAAGIQAAIVAASGEYAANTDLSTVDFPTISWDWDFDAYGTTNDSALGNNAAEGNAATIEITVGATITQID